MKILLDTHLLLWAAENPRRVPRKVRVLLDDNTIEPFFSSASIWEIAIKQSLGRKDFRVDPRVLCRGLRDNGYAELFVDNAHALEVTGLPPLHKDPFDRMLVAQARVERIRLFTADPVLADYGVPVELV